MVCEVESDCWLQSNKAVFIHSKYPIGLPRPNITGAMDFSDPSNPIIDVDDEDEEECCITIKDIKDLNFAVQHKVDCVAVSGVHSARDIQEAKFILGNKTNIRILAKIQDAQVKLIKRGGSVSLLRNSI